MSPVSHSAILRERPGAAAARGVYVTLDELVMLGLQEGKLQLDARRKSLAALAGKHRSSFRGRGMDFEEVRIYNPGDDIRTIDWRVTARTGKAHTKIFREERERPVFVVVDQRQSMFFGSRQAFKSVVAAKTAAILAWAARAQGDRIGGFLFNDNATHQLRPVEGNRGVQLLLRAVVQFNQLLEPQTPVVTSQRKIIREATEGLAQVVKPGSLVFMLSDFSQFDDIALQQLAVVRRHSDLIALSIHDPLERQLPPSGTYGFSDGEHLLRADTADKKARKNFAMRFVENQQRLRTQLSAMAIPVLELSTDDIILEVLNRELGLHAGSGRGRR